MSSATITAKTGPGATVTSLALSDVQGIDFEFDKRMFAVRHGLTPIKTTNFSYEEIATVTFSISGKNTTVTIST